LCAEHGANLAGSKVHNSFALTSTAAFTVSEVNLSSKRQSKKAPRKYHQNWKSKKKFFQDGKKEI